MTTGQFFYDENGKRYKVFGPDDADALKILKRFMNIVFVSADKRGFKISKKRISMIWVINYITLVQRKD